MTIAIYDRVQKQEQSIRKANNDKRLGIAGTVSGTIITTSDYGSDYEEGQRQFNRNYIYDVRSGANSSVRLQEKWFT